MEVVRNDQSWVLVDTREWMQKDPSTSIGFGENGTFARTQQTMFSQPGFVALTKELVQYIENGVTKVALMCNKGIHRSDTEARVVEEALNMLVDGYGQRLYNCKHFAISETKAWRQYNQLKSNIESWAEAPWVVIEGGPIERRSRFGYDAAMGSAAAHEGARGYLFSPVAPPPPGLLDSLQPPPLAERRTRLFYQKPNGSGH